MAQSEIDAIRTLLTSKPRPVGWAERRQRLDEVGSVRPVADDVTLAEVDAGGVPGEWSTVPGSDPSRVLMFFHGGGYCSGSIRSHRRMVTEAGRAAALRTLAIGYRLAPEHPFPAALEDAVRAYRWLAARLEPRRIAFAGDSAGGGLALATMHKLRDDGEPLPGAAVALSPWTDLALTGESLRSNADADPMMNAERIPAIADNYLAGADPRHPYASPLYGDASRLPPTLIHAGSDEILRDDAVRMAERMRQAGCEVEIDVWPRMPHAWHLYARILPEGRQAIDRIGAFLERRI